MSMCRRETMNKDSILICVYGPTPRQKEVSFSSPSGISITCVLQEWQNPLVHLCPESLQEVRFSHDFGGLWVTPFLPCPRYPKHKMLTHMYKGYAYDCF